MWDPKWDTRVDIKITLVKKVAKFENFLFISASFNFVAVLFVQWLCVSKTLILSEEIYGNSLYYFCNFSVCLKLIPPKVF